jgi:hypothetical protein
MPPKRKAPAKAPTKAPPKPRTVTPKEKPATMSQKEWEEEKRHYSFVTDNRKRRRVTALEAAKAASAAKVCLSLGGGLSNFSSTPSSLGS